VSDGLPGTSAPATGAPPGVAEALDIDIGPAAPAPAPAIAPVVPAVGPDVVSTPSGNYSSDCSR